MAERTGRDFSFGTFGRPVYNVGRRRWAFEDVCRPGWVWQLIQKPRIIRQPSIPGDVRSELFSNDHRSRVQRKQIEALVRRYPELQTASSLLPDLARVSKATEEAVSRHDPSKGNLLATGRIRDEVLKYAVTVVALPTGPSGSDLCLIRCHPQRAGWDDNKAAYLTFPTARGEEALWKGPGVPIQQILFTTPSPNTECFLAVRLITKVVVFKPVFRYPSPERTPWLDVNLIDEISIDVTGGCPYADLTFNSSNPRQLAVIDQTGGWSVWEIDGRPRLSITKIWCSKPSLPENSSAAEVYFDGWARIIWLAGPSTLLLAARRQFQVVALLHTEPIECVQMDSDLAYEARWILDVVSIPSSSQSVAILTSTYVHFYRLSQAKESKSTAKKLLSIKHFLNVRDMTLRLFAFADAVNDDIIMIIHSAVRQYQTSYRVRLTNPERMSVVKVGEISNGAADALEFQSMNIGATNIGGKLFSNSIASGYQQDGLHFHWVFTLSKDLSLKQAIYAATPPGGSGGRVLMLSWTRTFQGPKSAKVARKALATINASSNSSSDEYSLSSENEEEVCTPPKPQLNYRHGQVQRFGGRDWTVSLELMARKLNKLNIENTSDLEQIFEESRSLLSQVGHEERSPSMQTMLETVSGEVNLRDVEEAERRLAALLHFEPFPKDFRDQNAPGDEDLSSRLVLRRIDLPDGSQLSPIGQSLSGQYNMITSEWLQPQLGSISELTQSAKEQLARRVIIETTLSLHVLRMNEPQNEPQQSSQPGAEEQTQRFDLPIRMRRAPMNASTSAAPINVSGQIASVLPTPSPSAPPSTITSSSQPSAFEAAELSRLSHYTSFSQTRPPALSRSLTRVISHWKPDTDPDDYEWVKATRQLRHHHEDREDEDEMTEKERQRLQRKAERYIHRQRRAAEESQRQQMLSSQAPAIISASSPPPQRVDSQRLGADAENLSGGGSQNFGTGTVTASQVLPRRHGGRPSPRKKKRKSGF